MTNNKQTATGVN